MHSFQFPLENKRNLGDMDVLSLLKPGRVGFVGVDMKLQAELVRNAAEHLLENQLANVADSGAHAHDLAVLDAHCLRFQGMQMNVPARDDEAFLDLDAALRPDNPDGRGACKIAGIPNRRLQAD